MENSSTFFYPLKAPIVEIFLPDLFGSSFTEAESKLFFLPFRYAGILDQVKQHRVNSLSPKKQ